MPTLPKLDWQTVDVSTMPKQIKTRYDAWRTKVEAVNAERGKMEDEINAYLKSKRKVPDGKVIRFGYKWGKMAIAFAEPDEVRAAGASDNFTF